jgi:hypothetical protein
MKFYKPIQTAFPERAFDPISEAQMHDMQRDPVINGKYRFVEVEQDSPKEPKTNAVPPEALKKGKKEAQKDSDETNTLTESEASQDLPKD